MPSASDIPVRRARRTASAAEKPPAAIDPERRYLGREALAFCRRATSPERWKAIRSWALGTPAAVIAQREGIPLATVYSRIWHAREDIRAAFARDDAAIYVRRKK